VIICENNLESKSIRFNTETNSRHGRDLVEAYSFNLVAKGHDYTLLQKIRLNQIDELLFEGLYLKGVIIRR